MMKQVIKYSGFFLLVLLLSTSCGDSSNTIEIGSYLKCESEELIVIHPSQMACYKQIEEEGIIYDLGILNDTIVYIYTEDSLFKLENGIEIGDSMDDLGEFVDSSIMFMEKFQGLVVPLEEWNAVLNYDELGVNRITHFIKRR